MHGDNDVFDSNTTHNHVKLAVLHTNPQESTVSVRCRRRFL